MDKTYDGEDSCFDNRQDNNNTKICVRAHYTSYIEFNMDCDLTKVDQWYIKYGTLHIVLKDGTEKECEGEQRETDYKYPGHVDIDDLSDEEYETITV